MSAGRATITNQATSQITKNDQEIEILQILSDHHPPPSSLLPPSIVRRHRKAPDCCLQLCGRCKLKSFSGWEFQSDKFVFDCKDCWNLGSNTY